MQQSPASTDLEFHQPGQEVQGSDSAAVRDSDGGDAAPSELVSEPQSVVDGQRGDPMLAEGAAAPAGNEAIRRSDRVRRRPVRFCEP